MITEERKQELLEMEEYYNCLSEEEYEEEKQNYEKWWNTLTVEEREFIDKENEKYMEFVEKSLNLKG